MIRITIYAGPGDAKQTPNYEATVTSRIVSERDVSEELRQIGLEWRQADYFPTRQTVITFDPVAADGADVRLRIREAAEALERTGLL